ncbi:pheromone shutdown-related protein TraB [Methanococcus voltae]|uniref:Pheromone shutdown-related protein TraB n=2 Tax=Methanococcus voltae TaxID=2188 RepID=A0A8J7REZ3_METVO|nr:TraB/GumN family protein [Methanococcus voltae]MBP2200632.1 pheromone shutdown-related protein TraB [Methanococcus voltae]MCS3921357.1 pheromone shutdown-related protein TraB [Methanococcus voltae PS]
MIKINNGQNECEIHLIGTAHVSDKSIEDVSKAVKEINPDIIAIELDQNRFFKMFQERKGTIFSKNLNGNKISSIYVVQELETLNVANKSDDNLDTKNIDNLEDLKKENSKKHVMLLELSNAEDLAVEEKKLMILADNQGRVNSLSYLIPKSNEELEELEDTENRIENESEIENKIEYNLMPLNLNNYHIIRLPLEDKPMDLMTAIKHNKISQYLLHNVLADFQKTIGEKFNIKPGSEMKEAISLSIDSQKPLLLMDRPIDITLSRLISSMSLKDKIKLFTDLYGGDSEEIELDKETIDEMIGSADELIEILKDASPTFYTVLVDERDKYMAKNLYDYSFGRNKIVAIIGAGHKKGITNYLRDLENKKTIDLSEIMENKKKDSLIKKIFKWILKLIPFVILAIIIYGFYVASSNPELLQQLTIEWVLINGILSSLGVVIARGKPITAIVAFIAAPLTSLCPFIGAGWVAGAMELKYRPISLNDIQNMFKVDSISQLLEINTMKILMVAALANLGSTIGTLYFSARFLGV